jgi:AraC-like DNA-binding protein
MTGDGLATDRLMLLNPQRIFYAGLLGNPRGKASGALSIYVTVQGYLKATIAGRITRDAQFAIVPPYAPHEIESEFCSILCVCIEPETVSRDTLDQLSYNTMNSSPFDVVGRVRAAYEHLCRQVEASGFTTKEFDNIFFGETFEPRLLDPRIAHVVSLLSNRFTGKAVTAADCAASVHLSLSRFLHLFKEEIGITFRIFKAWKRARHLLHFVNCETNFAHLAQNIGYPDSTHFCHSIRRFYGLQPRDIFSGSRGLAIYRGDATGTPDLLH